MIPTVIGFATLAIGLLLLVRGGLSAMFVYLNLVSLMGGAAAIILTALGGSSVPPVDLALGFAALRILLPGSGRGAALIEAVRANIAMVAFVAFGVLMAFVGPRLFAGQIQVVPMKLGHMSSLFQTALLVPTSQNVTTAIYLVGTLIGVLVAHVAMRDPQGPARLVDAGVAIGWLHAATGIVGAIVRGTPANALITFFRNGNYAQTDQVYGGYARLSGIMPEPSSYALFAFAWFVFLAECWLRDVRPGRTGPIALVLLLVLIASTSSTAYAGLGGYALILALRTAAFPRALGPRKAVVLLGLVATVTILGMLALLLKPALVDQLGAMAADLTVNKKGSESGLQRVFWAKLGLQAFVQSGGLGIGPGSFRSSSIVTAIVGSTGVIGSALFLLYLVQVLKPLRLSTYLAPETGVEAIGVASGWAACVMVVPAAAMAASPDPGATFATFAGCAIGLRALRA